ncbi:contractile injection system protein, VgrG/Pvc8 family [Trinickia caryophylli]|uniref:Type VI secretion system secreted protein VgrG n=1 Tax=Trinickia caryophylli TaxID=28094 RepID=A0A1X7D5B0_TRICW|nr:contractile injection system protein, VgrG/Pvc8 family [Trinickia caryophylli]WQE14980.1 contractile injection system protein, VgrG/Pvc8 family [Trinickia caryophylli]GLU31291.1 hypothetical protein Busp01_11330 [Trinickia caryophylli]SMF09183.1 type VI secretion system secreted protein VgrG [Trinickia caryophylli]
MSENETIGATRIARIGAPAPAVFLHVAVFLPGGRILGAETFRLVKLSGEEKVSEPFEFQLELRADTVASGAPPPLRFDQLIGQSITFAIDRPDFSAPAGATREILVGASNGRFAAALASGAADPTLSVFNGIVTAFSMSEPGVYRATVKPALWKLALTNRYRAIAQKSVAQAIETLMSEHGVRCTVSGLGGSHNLAQTRIQDWLQAGESDFALLQRLLAKARIHYYFEHTANAHTVVFSNAAQYPAIPFGRPLRYTYADISALGLAQSDVISQYTYEQSLVTTGVECVLARQQETWDVDAIPTFETYGAQPGDAGVLPFRQYKQYQYGVSDWQARELAQTVDASRRASAERFSGASTCAQLRVGHSFTVVMPQGGAAGMNVQPTLDNRRFVATHVSHEAAAEGDYHNSFDATDASLLITPFSLEETQQGSLLATVVNADGSTTPKTWRYYAKPNFEMGTSVEIDRDANPTSMQAKGVYVAFATDRGASGSSAPVWVKLASHMQTVPEVGVTVVVARAQDESELPEIQSIVHANGSRVVTPSGWTASTSIGNSYSTSYSDGKSIRFGASSDVSSDQTLENAIDIVTAAYATKQYRDTSYSQGASYSYSTSEDKEQGLLSRSFSYGSTYGSSWAAQQESFSAIGKTYSQSIVGESSPSAAQPQASPDPSAVSVSTSTVHGDAYSESTNHGNVKNLSTIDGNSASENTVTRVSSSKSTVTESTSESLTGKSTSSAVTGMSSNTNVVGVSDDASTIGVSVSRSTIGVQRSLGMTGSTSAINMTGASSSVAMTGEQTAVNMVGVSTTVDMQGSSSSVSLVGSATRLNLSGESMDVTLAGVQTQVSMSSESHIISFMGPGLRMSEEAETPEVKMSNATITIVGIIQIYL